MTAYSSVSSAGSSIAKLFMNVLRNPSKPLCCQDDSTAFWLRAKVAKNASSCQHRRLVCPHGLSCTVYLSCIIRQVPMLYLEYYITKRRDQRPLERHQDRSPAASVLSAYRFARLFMLVMICATLRDAVSHPGYRPVAGWRRARPERRRAPALDCTRAHARCRLKHRSARGYHFGPVFSKGIAGIHATGMAERVTSVRL